MSWPPEIVVERAKQVRHAFVQHLNDGRKDAWSDMTNYLLLAASAFVAQVLMFVPIVPLLIATGALAAQGQVELPFGVAALTGGIAAGDFLLYLIGRRHGRAILGPLCRIALEPSTCVRRTEKLFGRYGAATLLFAKFVPGLSTVALPLAGVFQMRPRRFAARDIPGVLLWVSAYVAVGYASWRQLATIRPLVPWSARTWIVLALILLAGYLVSKQFRRRRVLRQLRGPRVSAEELHRRLADAERLIVIDLRHPVDFEGDSYVIPGSLHIPAEEFAQRHLELPRDREVVLYCTCPDEITSAQVALRLRHGGIRQVRLLQGGFSAWRAAQFPVEFRGPLVPVADRTLNAA